MKIYYGALLNYFNTNHNILLCGNIVAESVLSVEIRITFDDRDVSPACHRLLRGVKCNFLVSVRRIFLLDCSELVFIVLKVLLAL